MNTKIPQWQAVGNVETSLMLGMSLHEEELFNVHFERVCLGHCYVRVCLYCVSFFIREAKNGCICMEFNPLMFFGGSSVHRWARTWIERLLMTRTFHHASFALYRL